MVVEKEELEFIEPIIERLVTAYLDGRHNFPWFIGFSNGKDSSTLGYCVWKAVERIPKHLRNRMVYFATSDTLLEHPHMRELMEFSYENMNQVAKENELPVEAFLVKPKMTVVMKMIAHGNPLPTPKSEVNRWCTDLLKLKPMETLQEKLIEKHGGIIIMVGTRLDESQKRATSIKKHSIEGEFIFPKKDARPNAEGFYEKYMSHPIVDLDDEQVWRTITYSRILPWKTKATTIRKMYEGAGECPIQVDKASSKPCGGSSRNGCMICMMTTSQDDKMLQAFIDKGEEWATHMNRLRRFIKDSLFDARLRRPVNAWRRKRLDWVNPMNQNYDQKLEEWKEAKGKKATREAYLEQFQSEQDAFAEVSEGLCADSSLVYPYLSLAGYTLQARILLLKAFLYTQEVSGVKLVSDEELEYVKKVWSEEFGWVENEEDLRVEFPEYHGGLVLNPDYTINVEETTIPNLTIYQTIVDHEKGWGMIVPPIENKKLTPPPRKRRKITKLEEIAELTKPTPKTINVNSKLTERYEAFYVSVDWGGNEKEIVEHLERSSFKMSVTLPYYWLPSGSIEKRMDWKEIEVRDHLVYWNSVVFIVCDPKIGSQEEAIAFVDKYIESGEPDYNWGSDYLRKLEEAQTVDHFKDQYLMKYKGFYPIEARRKMLQEAEDPDYVPQELKTYAGITDEELVIARVMRYQSLNKEMVEMYCQGDAWNEVAVSMIEGLEPYEAKHLLLWNMIHPNVLPKAIKEYAEVGDNNLLKAREIRHRGNAAEFWKQFHLAYLIKGMPRRDVLIFLMKNNYAPSDVPKLVMNSVGINPMLMALAYQLKEMGMPENQIAEELFPHTEDNVKDLSSYRAKMATASTPVVKEEALEEGQMDLFEFLLA